MKSFEINIFIKELIFFEFFTNYINTDIIRGQEHDNNIFFKLLSN
jgi:hypothetical protein